MPSPSSGKSGAASQFPEGRSHPPNKRKFYIVRRRVVSNAHGFILQNEEALFQGRPPIYVDPFGPRGFKDYPEVPHFIADIRLTERRYIAERRDDQPGWAYFCLGFLSGYSNNEDHSRPCQWAYLPDHR
jgi:hypothetical protein